ncbi:MAG TPA: kelch repeat-containing protein, partial [Opitutaceae bacterium]|nr:kelch repeat-containing protein [Opitutaceae bacterium]
MLLLSDGTVMGLTDTPPTGGGTFSTASNIWFRLTPDSHGSYVNGTWGIMAAMNDPRLYFASQVLQDGRVFVAGGEYGAGGTGAEVYDPTVNAWTRVASPSGVSSYSDCISEMLPDGTVLVSPVSGEAVTFNPFTNSISAAPTPLRNQDEASWVKLPDNSILTNDADSTLSERYIPSMSQWINDGTLPVALWDTNDGEIGPGILLPNGKALFLGATGNTALYTPSGNTTPGTWTAGPVIPGVQGTPDDPAALLVTGNALCAVTQVPPSKANYPNGTSFLEYDPIANSFNAEGSPTGFLATWPSYTCRFLALPDGTVLFAYSTGTLFVYKPSGSPLAAAKPTITSITQNNDGSYLLTGTLLNGISEGAEYGDDSQMSTNRPLVRLTDAGGNVSYARTYNWSSTGVATGITPLTTEFAKPPNGTYSVAVVANGVASAAANLTVVNPT